MLGPVYLHGAPKRSSGILASTSSALDIAVKGAGGESVNQKKMFLSGMLECYLAYKEFQCPFIYSVLHIGVYPMTGTLNDQN